MWRSVPFIAALVLGQVLPAARADAKGLEMNDPSKPTRGSRTSCETATFGGGCFWCLEAVFGELEGVTRVVSGYAGGTVKDPTYEQVCSGTTGHAEVVRIEFDPRVIGYSDLLDVFFGIHDPTTPNRQGADVGTQYRSVIFYHDDRQREMAEAKIRQIETSKRFDAEVVTQLEPLSEFYEAEDYHQDYFAHNPDAGYCRVVIEPKLERFRQTFTDKLK